GLVRGQMLFEAQAVELSAQPGEMVGVETEERLTTPWSRSLRFRHPWLQVNLFCGLLAAVVVGLFEHTIDRMIALAVFLPVLIGQAANTGVQALAVCLRGITLGDLRSGKERLLLVKELLLGTFNGALTGITGGIAMFIFATMVKSPSAVMLGIVVFLATTISCLISGVAGATVPLVLKKLGADPAMASSIVVTTFTDVLNPLSPSKIDKTHIIHPPIASLQRNGSARARVRDPHRKNREGFQCLHSNRSFFAHRSWNGSDLPGNRKSVG